MTPDSDNHTFSASLFEVEARVIPDAFFCAIDTDEIAQATKILRHFVLHGPESSCFGLNQAMTRAIEIDSPAAAQLLAPFLDLAQAVFFQEKWTHLMHAAFIGRVRIAEILANENPACVAATGTREHTALSLALMSMASEDVCFSMVSTLCRRPGSDSAFFSADITHSCVVKMTPLLIALKRDMRADILHMLWSGADFEGRSFALESAIRQKLPAERIDPLFSLLDGPALLVVWGRVFGENIFCAGFAVQDLPLTAAKKQSWEEALDICGVFPDTGAGCKKRAKGAVRL